MDDSFSLKGWPWLEIGQCREFWIPELGRFGPHCLGVVGSVPSLVGVAVFVLYYALRPVWRRRPTWLRTFAAEEVDAGLGSSDGVRDGKKGWTRWTVGLTGLAVVNVGAGVAGARAWGGGLHFVPVVPCLLSLLLLALDRPQKVPLAMLAWNLVLVVDELVILGVQPGILDDWEGRSWAVSVFVTLATLVVLLAMPLQDTRLATDGISKPFSRPSSALRSPEDRITLWQWMTVSWMAPLIAMGRKRQLLEEDVWCLGHEFQHGRLHHLFGELQGSVLGRLLQANGWDIVIVKSLAVVETGVELGQVLLSQQLLATLEHETPNRRAAMVYASIIFFAQLAKAQSGVFSTWFGRRAYERCRGELITMLYEKTLRRKAFTFARAGDVDGDEGGPPSTLSDAASDSACAPAALWWWERVAAVFRRRRYQRLASDDATGPVPATPGKILNLIRNDAYEVAQLFWDCHLLVRIPLNLMLALALLWRMLGAASVVGILTLVAAQVVNSVPLRCMAGAERARRKTTDAKLQQTSQFVEAIRHLRWYDWQDAWLSRILATRRRELRRRVIVHALAKTVATANQLGAVMFPVAAFAAHTLVAGRPLTIDVAFPSLVLFGVVQNGLKDLPGTWALLLNARVAMRRIAAYMAEPDKGDLDAGDDAAGPPGALELTMHEASFAWPGATGRVLDAVTMRCGAGLSVVCGRVGSGKTALLHALLGELDQLGGERVTPDEPIGYASQTPWLQSMSIRDNILFGAEHDEVRYRRTLAACCLASFGDGDRAGIGENGIGLSGGQRARVALARAIYSRARILLLDDPIAALDHSTAATLLANLFGGPAALTSGRLVVLVTHRLDLAARYADQVLEVVGDGRVRPLVGGDLGAAPARVAGARELGLGTGTDSFGAPETCVHGGVVAGVYWQYVKAGKLAWWAVLTLLFVAFRATNLVYFWFLKQWGEAYEVAPDMPYQPYLHSLMASHGAQPDGWLDLDLDLPSPERDVRPWLVWFTAVSLALVATNALADAVLVVIGYHAGARLFEDALRSVAGATLRFYDVIPVGRLMNRLTSDMGTVDGPVADQLKEVAWNAIAWLASVAVIASVSPVFLAVAAAASAGFVAVFARFLPMSRALRRLEMVFLSPLMSDFGTLPEGLTTVRAMRAQPHFERRVIVDTDTFQKMDHFFWALQTWLQLRLDALSATTTFAVTTAALWPRGAGRDALSSGAVAFVLTSAANLVMATHSLCRRYGELQMQLVSVERVLELTRLEAEQPRGGVEPPVAEGWPGREADDIVFEDATIRYAPELPPSLSRVTLRIPPRASVAVTGRSGSGKSTFALALLAAVTTRPGEGSVSIGGLDLADVDRRALRRCISFVAQDPVLFPGSLRDNLDPLHEFSEEACAAALTSVLGSGFGLRFRIAAGGKNLSQGQRQLVGLARAVLRQSPVVVLDEATASIDRGTTEGIQEVLREALRGSTVVTIAHRLEAVRHANFRIVLERGEVKEAGRTPEREH